MPIHVQVIAVVLIVFYGCFLKERWNRGFGTKTAIPIFFQEKTLIIHQSHNHAIAIILIFFLAYFSKETTIEDNQDNIYDINMSFCRRLSTIPTFPIICLHLGIPLDLDAHPTFKFGKTVHRNPTAPMANPKIKWESIRIINIYYVVGVTSIL